MDPNAQSVQASTTTSVTTESLNPTPEQDSSSSWYRPVLIALGIGIGLFILFVIFWMISYKKSANAPSQANKPTISQQASLGRISGTLTFEGYASPEAYIAISARKVGTPDFADVVSGLVPGKDTTWTWNGPTSGTNYEIRATLKARGKVIQESATEIISVPASNVDLNIVSEQKPAQPATATLSGTVDVQGYIPQGSTISIFAKQGNDGTFAPVATNLSPTDNIPWSWSNATTGTTYQIKAELVDANNNVLSKNEVLTVTAPATNQFLQILSTQNPPQPTVVGLSGTITINGNIPQNSYITLATRPTGTGAFNQVASNIAATNGVSWKWNAAQEGSIYDIQAYLWANGKPYAQSQIITDTAPSTNDILIINAQVPLAPPSSSTMSISCGGQQGNMYQATVNYNTQGNLTTPIQYNIVLTLASQGTQAMNTTVNPANPSQSQSLTTTYIITSGATYYAQYAYSSSTNPNNFSPLSLPIQFVCN